MMWLAIIFALLSPVRPTAAALPQATLAEVSATPPPDAHIDLDLLASDTEGKPRSIRQALDGRPAFLTFVDYTCRGLCGTTLTLLTSAIAEAHLNAAQYRLVVLGLDPADSPRSAIALSDKAIPPDQRSATVLLLPDRDTIARATQALGYTYVYDADDDQLAHPAAVYAIGADGVVRAVLSPFTLTASEIRQSLEPGQPPSTLTRRLRLLCYAYDPTTGRYTFRILAILKWAAAITVALMAAAVLFLVGARTSAR